MFLYRSTSTSAWFIQTWLVVASFCWLWSGHHSSPSTMWSCEAAAATTTTSSTPSNPHATSEPPETASSSTQQQQQQQQQQQTKSIQLRLHWVRHGESAANQWGLLAGQSDVPLTELGVQQAHQLGKHYYYYYFGHHHHHHHHLSLHQDFWRIYASDLVRATNTAAHLFEGAAELDQEEQESTSNTKEENHVEGLRRLQVDRRLRERSYGARQGLSKRLTEEQALEVWTSHGMEPPPYETNEDLWERTWNWLQESILLDLDFLLKHGSLEETETEYNVLVVSHAGIIRTFVEKLFSLEMLKTNGAQFDANRNDRLIIPNASVTVVEFEITPQSLQNSTQFLQSAKLIELGQVSHLEHVAFHDD